MSGCGDQDDDGYVVKMRGLPWSATPDDIMKFFSECNILNGKNGIHLTSSREGRPSGEAFVEFESEDDLEIAVNKDREHIGSRYIEVFKVNRAEMDWVVRRSGPSSGNSEDGCVRLRGLPFGCSKEEIAQFFAGLEIVPNGITLLTDYSGRSSGEAYVQFVNTEVADRALQKHREKIGHRYIEIFRSSLSEVSSVLGYGNNRRGGSGGGSGGGLGSGGGGLGSGGGGGMYNSRPSPYDRGDRYGNQNRFQRGPRSFKGSNFSNNSDYGYNNRSGGGGGGGGGNSWSSQNNGSGGGGGRYEMDSWGDDSSQNGSGLHCIHMRGLPFKATPADISEFFTPLVPITVRLIQDHTGRASGEADVEFASHEDAMRAMNKDKCVMQHRYIELFMNSPRGGGGGSSSGGGGLGSGGRSWGSGGGGGGGGGGYGGRRRL